MGLQERVSRFRFRRIVAREANSFTKPGHAQVSPLFCDLNVIECIAAYLREGSVWDAGSYTDIDCAAILREYLLIENGCILMMHSSDVFVFSNLGL